MPKKNSEQESKRARLSGPSGLNKKPRMTLHAEQDQFDRWDAAAARHDPPLTRSEWLRHAADEQDRRERRKS